MKFKKIKNESTEAELVNDEESGSRLYEVGLWWGSGYMLDMYKAYAFDEEEALNYVVAHIEKTHPKWLEGSDECAHDMMKEYDEESPEFQETFMYVDATGEGADKPHFIWAENLRIRQIYSSTNESKIGSIKKLANGCKMRDMGDCFIVTDPHGKNIGQCRTEIEAETIAEEYGSKVNESMQDELKTNKKVTDKVEELIQAVYKDSLSHSNEKMSRIAFKQFERSLDKAMFDYWEYDKD